VQRWRNGWRPLVGRERAFTHPNEVTGRDLIEVKNQDRNRR